MKLPTPLPSTACPPILAAWLVLIVASLGTAQEPAAKPARPVAKPLKLPNLPAVPEAVLKVWAEMTANIQKMDGEIKRIEYEEVFKVEKHSEGKFYYEQPDKGRLDLTGLKFPPKAQGGRFPLAAGDSEEWVCDGTRIFQIHRDLPQPEANVFEIPADQRGQNIMHGPLPFLFGMPPEVAKKRYWLFLKKHDKEKAYILAYPKLASDAQNYRYAEVVLSKKTYLPLAVKLRNPADTGDTVYTFDDIVKNRKFTLFQGDPFTPDMRGVKPAGKVPGGPIAGPGPGAGPRPQAPLAERVPKMPSLIGLHGKKVAEICSELDVKPRFLRGDPAVRDELKHRVYQQDPPADVPLVSGQTIKVTLYDAPAKG